MANFLGPAASTRRLWVCDCVCGAISAHKGVWEHDAAHWKGLLATHAEGNGALLTFEGGDSVKESL